MVNAFRYGFLGQSDVGLGVSLRASWSLALVALFGACVWLMEKGTGTRE